MRISLFTAALLTSIPAAAAPVVETVDRMEINWSSLRVRYYGEAPAGSIDLAAAEKQARAEGLAYIESAVRQLNPEADAKDAAKSASKNSSSYNTTFFGDGSVRVHLESQLPRAVPATTVQFRQKDAAQPGAMAHSGVVFQLDKATKPTAQYKVVDEAGEILFDVGGMAEEAYGRNLMGRWYRRPTAAELAETVGNSPATIEASAVSPGVLRVNKAAWTAALEGQKPLLTNGLIVLAMP